MGGPGGGYGGKGDFGGKDDFDGGKGDAGLAKGDFGGKGDFGDKGGFGFKGGCGGKAGDFGKGDFKGGMPMPMPMPMKGGKGDFMAELKGEFKGAPFGPIGGGKGFEKGSEKGRLGPYEPPPGLGPAAEVNEIGLPMRPGREQCLVYVNTGLCQNGLSCIFDHPRGIKPPALGKVVLPLPGSGSAPAIGAPPPGMPPPPLLGLLPPGLPTKSEVPLPSSAPSALDGIVPVIVPPNTGVKEEAGDADKDAGASYKKADEKERKEFVPVQYNEDGLPIRPGAQKCPAWLRTGICNFGPTCRFDHPPGLGGILARGTAMGTFPLMVGGPAISTEGGMPRRPGKEQCPFLAKTGHCPFGMECRFDHAPGGVAETMAPRPTGGGSSKSSKPVTKDRGLGGTKSRRPVFTRNNFGRA